MGKKKVVQYSGLQVATATGRTDTYSGDNHWFGVDEEDGYLYIYDDPHQDVGDGFIATYAPRTWESVRLVS